METIIGCSTVIDFRRKLAPVSNEQQHYWLINEHVSFEYKDARKVIRKNRKESVNTNINFKSITHDYNASRKRTTLLPVLVKQAVNDEICF